MSNEKDIKDLIIEREDSSKFSPGERMMDDCSWVKNNFRIDTQNLKRLKIESKVYIFYICLTAPNEHEIYRELITNESGAVNRV